MTETKVLKQLVRDIIEPDRDLGHSDRHGKKAAVKEEEPLSNGDSTEKPVRNHTTVPEEEAAAQFREVAEQACEDCQ
jgi:hypothetical protein